MATGLFNLKQVNQAISQGAWSGYIAPRWVEYLTVAGGAGAGGNYGGGGGGAGGLLTGMVSVVAGTSYTVTVGGGGAASAGTGYSTGTNGVASVFGGISSVGGGGGADGQVGTIPLSGGSGGGAGSAVPSTQISVAGAQGIFGQGNAGGRHIRNDGSSGYSGGGGGGAGTIGLNSYNETVAGNGGAGIASAITGTVVAYAGGGGGGAGYSATASGGVGGVGGGGTAGTSGNGTAASVNTGGGGGGGGFNVSTIGGNGGSGIVVVRYPGNVQFYTGGTVTYVNGYVIHTFTANGTLAPTTPAFVADYQITRSLRFNSTDSAYLNRTPASAGNRTTWTFSLWLKRSKLGATGEIFTASTGSEFFFNTSDTLSFFENGGAINLTTTQVFRDPSAWYHLVVTYDTTQVAPSNRVKLYVNGSQVAAFSTALYPTQNTASNFNNNTLHNIGEYFGGGAFYYDGYMTEINFIDGQALTPSSFGYVNPATGAWSPLKFIGAYGTNGFYVNFSDNSNTTAATLGADYSGNGNNWTPNNFSVTAGAGNDSLVDSPTSYGTDTGVGGEVRGNYSTMNPLQSASGITLSNGNLDFTSSSAANLSTYSTIGMSSGKWYCEFIYTTRGASPQFGLSLSTNVNINADVGSGSAQYGYDGTNGNKVTNSTGSAYGATYGNNDVIGMAFDADAGTLTFYKNGVSQGVAFTGLTAGTYLFGVTSYQATGNTNFGQRAFAYTAPSGYKALCTQNLPTPTIGATSATLAGKFFSPVIYTGAGSGQAITGVGFQPDFVWMKRRSAAGSHILQNAVTGVTKGLQTNDSSAEFTDATTLTAFNSDGFTAGGNSQTNASGSTYVAWNWKANGTGSSNTAGSITSTVSASTTSGFSVVTYTGTGANATVGHGLGVAPSFIIVKRRDAGSSWNCYQISLGASQYIQVDGTAGAATNTGVWNNTAPTSSVFSIGTAFAGVNASGSTHVAYCFAPIAGYSAFGSYTGNASTDGTFVFTGFRPAYVMIKSSSAATDWIVYDAVRNTYNVTDLNLRPNTSDAESSQAANYIDLLSNGFKLRGDGSGSINASGATYIYMAFATSPFKYSLAR